MIRAVNPSYNNDNEKMKDKKKMLKWIDEDDDNCYDDDDVKSCIDIFASSILYNPMSIHAKTSNL